MGNKKKYISPEVSVVYIRMENGSAAGSASITPGGSNSNYQPEIDDWTTDDGYNNSIDL